MNRPWPAQLPGLDVQKGLERVVNDKNIYLIVLKDYLEHYQDLDKQITALLSDSNNHKELATLIHTLKGVSGNISANNLFEHATTLDKLFKINEHPSEEQWSLLCSLNDQLVKSINKLSAMV